ncbi:MAG: hypothetical protein HY532_05280 [Chloroflexi bacterium]|nr:hypothetical protein [Chloroflexota bacterium]
MLKKEKSFSYHWGSGVVAEEARVQGLHHVPTIQMLKYTEGEATGQVSIRFCHYSHSGRFSRSPLIMSPEEVEEMRVALEETPELRAMLRRLVAN